MLKKNIIKILTAGRLSYAQGLQLQSMIEARHHRPQEKQDDSSNHDTLIIVEHSPVYTIGLRTKDYSEKEINSLRKTGADFYKTNRGGLITFHGPGQLVAYPIINLKHYKSSIKWYVHTLESCIINLCKNYYNLPAETSPYTGVWVNDKKICAMGIHGSRFITSHGLALNCNVDLSWFENIVPCGIKDKGVTSLTNEMNRMITIADVTPQLIQSFCETFECDAMVMTGAELTSTLQELQETGRRLVN